MTKRRRLIFPALAGLLILIACGPAALALIFAGSPGSEPRAPAATPSATTRPALIPGPSPNPDRRPAPSATATPTPAACKVSAGRVFLRAGPRRASRALAVLAGGDLLTILATPTETDQTRPIPTPAGARWLPVQAGNLAGWVYSDFCEAIK